MLIVSKTTLEKMETTLLNKIACMTLLERGRKGGGWEHRVCAQAGLPPSTGGWHAHRALSPTVHCAFLQCALCTTEQPPRHLYTRATGLVQYSTGFSKTTFQLDGWKRLSTVWKEEDLFNKDFVPMTNRRRNCHSQPNRPTNCSKLKEAKLAQMS